MIRVSIVTAYYNRKKLFRNTLLQLKHSTSENIEVIAVDDGSDEDNRIEDLQKEFSFLKVIRLERKEKWYINPCIPFNIGLGVATGDIIILQNPECIHYGDIIGYTRAYLKTNDYISFGAYSMDKETTDRISDKVSSEITSLNFVFNPFAITHDGDSAWYNHSVYRPKGFHWCTAIHAKELRDLGGFDERYALGIAFDDDELLTRIKKKGMNYRIIDEPFVLHQNHFNTDTDSKKSINPFYARKGAKFLWEKNEYLYNEYTVKRKSWRVPKRSKARLKWFDLFLTFFLKSRKLVSEFKWRVKNKLKRIFSVG